MVCPGTADVKGRPLASQSRIWYQKRAVARSNDGAMKTHPRPYILLLFLGSGSVTEKRQSVTTKAQVKDWLRSVAEMNMIADIEGVFVASGTATIGLSDWQQAAKLIRERYDEVDGFVIAHQGETAATAGAMLSLMLQGIGKPVVLSGVATPGMPNSAYGIKANIINAVQVATTDLAGVVAVVGSHIVRADSLAMVSIEKPAAIIGKIEFGIRLFGQQAHRHSRPWQVRSNFDTQVVTIEYVPGVTLHGALHITRGTRAVFISVADAPGSVVEALHDLRAALPKATPLVVYTGQQHRPVPGVLTVAGATRSSAFMRLMWALGQTTSLRRLQQLLNA